MFFLMSNFDIRRLNWFKLLFQAAFPLYLMEFFIKLIYGSSARVMLKLIRQHYQAVVLYSQVIVIAFLGNVRLFCHIHLCYGYRESQNSRQELPKYRRNVANDLKQSYLYGTNPSHGLHDMTKRPECEEHGVEAVQMTGYNKSSVVGH